MQQVGCQMHFAVGQLLLMVEILSRNLESKDIAGSPDLNICNKNQVENNKVTLKILLRYWHQIWHPWK